MRPATYHLPPTRALHPLTQIHNHVQNSDKPRAAPPMQVKLPCTARPQVHCMAGRGSAMGLLGRHGSNVKPEAPEPSVPSGFCAIPGVSLALQCAQKTCVCQHHACFSGLCPIQRTLLQCRHPRRHASQRQLAWPKAVQQAAPLLVWAAGPFAGLCSKQPALTGKQRAALEIFASTHAQTQRTTHLQVYSQ